jgi:hypothetical protein
LCAPQVTQVTAVNTAREESRPFLRWVTIKDGYKTAERRRENFRGKGKRQVKKEMINIINKEGTGIRNWNFISRPSSAVKLTDGWLVATVNFINLK